MVRRTTSSRTGSAIYKRNREKLRRQRRQPCALSPADNPHEIEYDAHTLHPRSFQADHTVPYSQGGTDDFSNLQAVCRACNRAKGDGIPRPRQGKSVSMLSEQDQRNHFRDWDSWFDWSRFE